MRLPGRCAAIAAMLVSALVLPGAALAQGAAAPAPGAAAAPPAAAWVTLGDSTFYNTSLRALVILFVLAILIESALAVIFNWRLFTALFYGRGVKTLVMIGVAALAVWTFDIDVVHTMLQQYGIVAAAAEPGTFSRLLTALILAGGSAGVYRVLVALGYREAKPPEAVQPKPKKEKAWISVATTRRDAVGPIYVRIRDAGPVTDASPARLAGVIAPQGVGQTIRSVFLLDRNRFPQAGGYEVETSRQYVLEVSARNAEGQAIASAIDGTYTFADQAMIDFRVVL